MSEKRNFYVELPRIKRKANSWEGKVIEYLLNHPSLKAATDFSMEALTAFWLAEALEGQVSSEELVKACCSAIEKLEGKLATVRRIAGVEKLPSSYTIGLSTSSTNVTDTKNNQNLDDSELVSTSDDQTLDEDVDDFMELELTEEMKQMNKVFGVE